MAVESQAISRTMLVVLALGFALVVAVSMVTDPKGGLAALVPFATVGLTLFAIVNPKGGLFALAPLVIWVDELKRLAVYFGGAYSITVMITLAMPLIVMLGLNVGFLMSVLFGKVKLDRILWFFWILGPLIGLAIFVAMTGGMANKGQRAANIALYMSLIPMICTYFRSAAEWRKYLSVQVIFALPAAAWAIKHYFFGFDQIEWTYALSGLSKVHSSQMMAPAPRPFGFFGSASALGCAGLYSAFSWWQAFRCRGPSRFGWLIAAVIMSWAVVVSTQRTILVYPFIVFATAWFLRTPFRTGLGYLSAFTIFGLAVANSEYILNEGLEKTNRAIAVNTDWGERVLKVSTLSDRIRGWQRLKDPESWSLAGTGKTQWGEGTAGIEVGSQDYNHDIINKILINYGVLGMLGIIIPGAIVLFTLHRVVWQAPDKASRNESAFVLALTLPIFGLSFIGGDNFNTNPINLQIWTAFAGVFVWRKIFQEQRLERRQVVPAPVTRGLPPQPIGAPGRIGSSA